MVALSKRSSGRHGVDAFGQQGLYRGAPFGSSDFVCGLHLGGEVAGNQYLAGAGEQKRVRCSEAERAVQDYAIFMKSI